VARGRPRTGPDRDAASARGVLGDHSAIQFTRLSPEPGTIELDELRASLDFQAPGDRPHVIANFVMSADGRAAFQGRSAPLSDDGDRALFHALRECVDAIMVGTGTLRTERYGELIKDPAAKERRASRGLDPDPLACVVTRSGELPLDIPLFAEARVVVFAPEPIDAVETIVLDPGEMTLASVLRRLRSDYEVRSVLCEGGPTLFGSLVGEQVVDELFLTVAPKLVGGATAPTIATGTELARPATLRLNSLFEREGSLFFRFEVLTGSA